MYGPGGYVLGRASDYNRDVALDVAKLLGPDVNVARSPQNWRINPKAFDLPQSYQGIVQSTPAGSSEDVNTA